MLEVCALPAPGAPVAALVLLVAAPLAGPLPVAPLVPHAVLSTIVQQTSAAARAPSVRRVEGARSPKIIERRIVFAPGEINTYGGGVEWYFQRYGDLELHRRMISDRARTDAFARALAEVVRPADVVLDVGTGTGVLAMLAAKAGAQQVHAVDRADIAEVARRLVRDNRLQKKVQIHQGMAADLTFPVKFDLIVSEWLGHFALVEGMLDDLCPARDRSLAEGGRMMPSDVELLLAPVDDPVLYHRDGPGYWREPVHGLDFSGLEDVELKQGRAAQLRVDGSSLLAPGRPLMHLDMTTVQPADPWRKGRLVFDIVRDGVLSGFCGWFVARLSPGVVLDTGPSHPDTHWAQTFVPFPPRLVRAGDRLGVGFVIDRDARERRQVQLALTVERKTMRYVLE